MSEVILYDYWRSSASYRVRIALNLKGVAYRSVHVSLIDGEHRDPDYVARNPQGFLPMLEVDGLRLTQSLAIIDYLDATYREPRMVSTDPVQRAQTLAQSLIIAADIHPVNNLRVLKYLESEFGADADATAKWYRHWIVEGFTALEAMAPEAGLFGGEAPNLADVCLVPQMANARRFDTPLQAFPKLVRIDEALRAIEAFAKAAPEAVKP